MNWLRQHSIALVALFVALGGTGYAASHYRITSISQISPHAQQQIANRVEPGNEKGERGATGPENSCEMAAGNRIGCTAPEAGARGERGEAGTPGVQGPQGQEGARGQKGEEGKVGVGITGPRGATGPTGPSVGPTG